MASHAPTSVPPGIAAPACPRRPLLWGFAGLLACAFLLRSALFGDPFAGYDEQFYLLTGSRMLHGAIPYVDIWDRKPIGPFLTHAFAASFGGNGVLAYQLLAPGSGGRPRLSGGRPAR